MVILGNLSVFFIIQHLTDFEEKYLKQVLLAQHFPTHLGMEISLLTTLASKRCLCTLGEIAFPKPHKQGSLLAATKIHMVAFSMQNLRNLAFPMKMKLAWINCLAFCISVKDDGSGNI